MWRKKANLVIGLTTYNIECLDISIPALGLLPRKFTLIIHNDNPDKKIKRRYIRKLGYRGKLHIINSEFNVGLLASRCKILQYIKDKKFLNTWTLFTDDDDILLDATIPSVGNSTFAIMQNAAIIRTQLTDVLRASKYGKYNIDNKNTFLAQPHIGITGTIIKTQYLIQWYDIIQERTNEISDINESISFRLPVDLIMWSGVNIIATNAGMSSIYMDRVNYIVSDIDTAKTKYGKPIAPATNAKKQIKSVILKYDAIIKGALNAAAPAGQD
jgi:hypothetical protein